jgi:hypothetical protein
MTFATGRLLAHDLEWISQMGLQQQLDAFRAEFARTAPVGRPALAEATIEELRPPAPRVSGGSARIDRPRSEARCDLAAGAGRFGFDHRDKSSDLRRAQRCREHRHRQVRRLVSARGAARRAPIEQQSAAKHQSRRWLGAPGAATMSSPEAVASLSLPSTSTTAIASRPTPS